MSTISKFTLYLVISILAVSANCSNCTDFTDGCYYCKTSIQCKYCLPGFRLYDGKCSDCLDYYCVRCQPTDPSWCLECAVRTSLNNINNQNLCYFCYQSNCLLCPDSMYDCIKCGNGMGVVRTFTSVTVAGLTDYIFAGICQSCRISNCELCGYDAYVCINCQQDYYLNLGGGCSRYVVPVLNCYAYLNQSRCLRCKTYFGININTGQCDPCYPGCVICETSNVALCYDCMNGYGIDYSVSPQACRPCVPECTSCLSTNYIVCFSCIPRFYVNRLRCQPCSSFCYNCTSNQSCIQCENGYYESPPSMICQLCPDECVTCQYNFVLDIPECTSCPYGAPVITIVSPRRCPDLICGDSITIIRPCDNQLDMPYDGCNNNCQVMPDFECNVNILTQSTICSYKRSLVMEVIEFKRVMLTNKLRIKISVFPPLHVFKISSQTQNNALFSVSMENTQVLSVEFSYEKMELQIQLEMVGVITTDTPITVTFDPSTSIRPEYFATPTQALTLTIDYGKQKIFFISPTQKAIVNVILYISYAIVVLGWLGCVIGLFLRHLAGIEAMLVVQFSWLVILWLKVPLTLPLLRIWPLKYSTGQAYDFESSDQANSTSSSEAAPFLTQFKLNPYHFHCNFNIVMTLFVIAMVAVIVTYARLRKFIRDNNLNIIDEIYKQDDQVMKEEGSKLEDHHEFAEQSLLTACMLSLVLYESASALFILKGDLTSAPSFTMLTLSGIALLIVLGRFFFNPRPYDYFCTSFKTRRLTLKHCFICFIHIVCLTVSIALLTAIPIYTYLPIVPLGIQLLYTILVRPYQTIKGNFRSAFNLTVMCMFIGFGVFAEKSTEQDFNSTMAYGMIIILFAGLFLVVIIGILISIYDHWTNRQIVNEDDKITDKSQNFKRAVIQEMGEFNLNRRMQELDANISFKPLIDPSKTVRNLTNQLQSNSSDDKESEDGIMRTQMKNFLTAKPLKIETIAGNYNQQNRHFLQAMMRAEKLKMRDNLEPQQLNMDQPQQGQPCKPRVRLNSRQDQHKYAHIALTTIKEEKKFIE